MKKIHFVRCALIFSGIFNVARKMLITKDQSAIRCGFSTGRWADWVVINPHRPRVSDEGCGRIGPQPVWAVVQSADVVNICICVVCGLTFITKKGHVVGQSSCSTKDQSAATAVVQRSFQGGLGVVGHACRIQILSSRIRLASRATTLRRGHDR